MTMLGNGLYKPGGKMLILGGGLYKPVDKMTILGDGLYKLAGKMLILGGGLYKPMGKMIILGDGLYKLGGKMIILGDGLYKPGGKMRFWLYRRVPTGSSTLFFTLIPDGNGGGEVFNKCATDTLLLKGEKNLMGKWGDLCSLG